MSPGLRMCVYVLHARQAITISLTRFRQGECEISLFRHINPPSLMLCSFSVSGINHVMTFVMYTANDAIYSHNI